MPTNPCSRGLQSLRCGTVCEAGSPNLPTVASLHTNTNCLNCNTLSDALRLALTVVLQQATSPGEGPSASQKAHLLSPPSAACCRHISASKSPCASVWKPMAADCVDSAYCAPPLRALMWCTILPSLRWGLKL